MNYLKLAAVFGVIAILYAVYWGIDNGGYTRAMNEVKIERDQERAKIAQESLEAAQNNLKTITKLEETKNENLKTIGRLRSDLANFRVRVPTAPCSGADPTGNNPTPGAGPLPNKPQTAFDDFKRGLESDAAEADTVVESCRVLMDWAKSLKK